MEREIKSKVSGSVTIGRSGTKHHRATMVHYTDGSKHLMIHCSCRGTNNGYAQSTARFSTVEANCKG